MSKIRTAITAMAVAAAMAGAQAFAADGALAPGKPAGVHQAARSPSLLLIGGAAVVAVVAIVVAVQNGNDTQCGSACTSPTTTT